MTEKRHKSFQAGFFDGSGGRRKNPAKHVEHDYLEGYKAGRVALHVALRDAERRIGEEEREMWAHHPGGSKRKVEYVGVIGAPRRGLVRWPLAGVYDVDLETGRLFGPSGTLIPWHLREQDLERARKDYEALHAETSIPVL